MSPNHIVVAMSGGVDSSVAAVLLAREGHVVTGVTMDIWCPTGDMGGVRAAGCCGAESAMDAADVCRQIGIEHYVINFRSVFEETVIEPFVEAYAAGQTPNPCIECNRLVKWGALLKWVDKLGADAIATGHYARVENGSVLKRGADRSKDQSYALYMLTRDELSRTLFPCGAYEKPEIRAIAAEAGLATADRDESQEICFVPDDDYVRLISERRPGAVRPGPILDLAGSVIGEHVGYQAYTPGQRKGLGLAGGPWYVVEVDAERNAVIVGAEAAVFASEVIVGGLVLRATEATLEASVMTRYRGPESRATVERLEGDRARIRFEKPQRAPAPGQAAVLYDDDVVLGGGTIVEVVRDR